MQLGRLPLCQLSYSPIARRAPTIQLPHPMAVRADDIALGRLGKDRCDPCSTDKTGDADDLRVASRWSKSIAHGGNRPPQSTHGRSRSRIQEPAVFGPATTALVQAWGGPRTFEAAGVHDAGRGSGSGGRPHTRRRTSRPRLSGGPSTRRAPPRSSHGTPWSPDRDGRSPSGMARTTRHSPNTARCATREGAPDAPPDAIGLGRSRALGCAGSTRGSRRLDLAVQARTKDRTAVLNAIGDDRITAARLGRGLQVGPLRALVIAWCADPGE